MLPQHIPLGHKDNFKLKAMRNSRLREGCPPPFCLKAGHTFPFVKVT